MDNQRRRGRVVREVWTGYQNEDLSDTDRLPHGMQQMWQNDFCLDGSVIFHDTETSVDYNLALVSFPRQKKAGGGTNCTDVIDVGPKTWQAIHDDINGASDVGEQHCALWVCP